RRRCDRARRDRPAALAGGARRGPRPAARNRGQGDAFLTRTVETRRPRAARIAAVSAPCRALTRRSDERRLASGAAADRHARSAATRGGGGSTGGGAADGKPGGTRL